MSSSHDGVPKTVEDDASARFALLEIDPLPQPPVTGEIQTKRPPAPVRPATRLKSVPQETILTEADTEALLEACLDQCLERAGEMAHEHSNPQLDREDWKYVQYEPIRIEQVVGALETYECLRRNLFRTRLDVRRQEWCSMGHHAVSREGFKFFLENGPIERVDEGGCAGMTVYRICPDCLKETLRQQVEWSNDAEARYRITQVYAEDNKFFYWDFDGKKRYGSYGSSLYESDTVPTTAMTALNIPPRIVLCMHDGQLELEEVTKERVGTYVYL